jgi:hypothetical protein
VEKKPNDPAGRVPCTSCGAPVFFVRTERGELMPLDADPVKDGNIVVRDWSVTEDGTTTAGKVAVALKGDLFEGDTGGEVRYKSHFATCTDPARHRKKRPKK